MLHDVEIRLLHLDDVSGRLRRGWRWTAQAQPGGGRDAMVFFGDLFSTRVAVSWRAMRTNVLRQEIQVFDLSSGEAVHRELVQGSLLGMAFDRGTQRLVWIDGAKTLRDCYFFPDTEGRKLQVRLTPEYFPNSAQRFEVEVAGDRVFVVGAEMTLTGGGYPMYIFSKGGSDQVRLPLPEGRTIRVNRGEMITLGSDGMLVAYTVADIVKGRPSRADLVGLQTVGEGLGSVVWKAEGPLLSQSMETVGFLSTPGHLLCRGSSHKLLAYRVGGREGQGLDLGAVSLAWVEGRWVYLLRGGALDVYSE